MTFELSANTHTLQRGTKYSHPVRHSIPTLLAATLVLAACDSDAKRLAEAIEQYCVTATECDEDSRYCNVVIECDDAGNCKLALQCDAELARDECEAEHEQLIEEQGSDQCVPLWTSFFQCDSTLSCIEFDTSTGYEICSDEVTEEFGEELFEDCGVPW